MNLIGKGKQRKLTKMLTQENILNHHDAWNFLNFSNNYKVRKMLYLMAHRVMNLQLSSGAMHLQSFKLASLQGKVRSMKLRIRSMC